MKENIVKSKSFTFAVKTVRIYQFLCEQRKEFILSKQLLRSGTSVGAMIRESEHAESRKDFIHKLAIAQKEINETIYWIDLLKETNYLSEEQYISINTDAIALIKLITSIIKSTKNKS
ncbi:four helix bundle protein [Cyclobacterium marinum]|uniref:four helix bundle protein n=2 Tax=Cyclobacterium marinum TaxID=104 RepID=UPI0030DDA7E0|tara:strand:+ start:50970 stop:51323 length:354 start_codon:yes stop_codon:yes gene_type:complete